MLHLQLLREKLGENFMCTLATSNPLACLPQSAETGLKSVGSKLQVPAVTPGAALGGAGGGVYA